MIILQSYHISTTAFLNCKSWGFFLSIQSIRTTPKFVALSFPNIAEKIASHLFAMMVCDFSDVSFQLSLPPENDFGKSFANKMGFQYFATECSMTIKKEQFASTQNSLSLVSEKSEDGLSPDGSLIIHGISDGTEIGSCLISDFDRIVCIHDVEIYEKYRGKGYGYQLICALLHRVFPKYDSAILHVTKENEPAYRLYKKVGFEVVEELEYYEV